MVTYQVLFNDVYMYNVYEGFESSQTLYVPRGGMKLHAVNYEDLSIQEVSASDLISGKIQACGVFRVGALVLYDKSSGVVGRHAQDIEQIGDMLFRFAYLGPKFYAKFDLPVVNYAFWKGRDGFLYIKVWYSNQKSEMFWVDTGPILMSKNGRVIRLQDLRESMFR